MIKKYQIFEAKTKTNWKEKHAELINSFIEMVNSNPVLGEWKNDDIINDLILPLKDISLPNSIDVKYKEFVKFVNAKDSKDYFNVELSTNGEVHDPEGRDSYYIHSSVTKWLDKTRLNSEVDVYYVIDIGIDYDEYDDYAKFNKLKVYKNEWASEFNDVIEFLKSLGFDAEDDSVGGRVTPYFSLTATIKLDKTDKTSMRGINLSDLVPANIVDDFERFIVRKNLSRADAEEIAKIFNKSETSKSI